MVIKKAIIMKEKHFKRRVLTVAVLTLALMMQSVTPVIAEAGTFEPSDTAVIEIEYDVDAVSAASPYSIGEEMYAATTTSDTTASAVSTVKFTDLKSSHWGYKNIQTLVGLGGIKGYPDNTFKPEGTITYAELTSILLGANGVDTTIPGGNWAQGVLQKAYDNKLVDSKTVPLSDASKPVTREKMALILSNAAKELRGENLTTLPDIQAYVRDWSSIKSAYQAYVNQAVAAGLIQGDTSSNFNASKNLTRAEASTISVRLIDQTQRIAPTKFSGSSTTADGYVVVAEGDDISDYVKQPEWAELMTRITTGESDYKVINNGNKFGLNLVTKQSGAFMIQYVNPGKVFLLDANGNCIGTSTPHTIGDTVKQPFSVDLGTVKYFVFRGGAAEDWTNYIVPNTLQ